MSVFIAILDDDPADRKQSERLLSRERDARAKEGEVIYFDSYGSEDALLPFFMKYDLILIDITSTTRDGMMVAVDLLWHGAMGKIVLNYGKIDYREKYGDEEGISFIPKPLWQKDFHRLVDLALEHHATKPPVVELRGKDETVYAPCDDILYAIDRGYYTAVALTGDRSVHVMEKLSAFCISLSPEDFIVTSKNTVINMKHVTRASGLCFTMSDGARIRFGLLQKLRITREYAAYARKVRDRRK